MQKALFTSKTEHWCTPEEVLVPVRKVGPIQLDPCSNPHSTVGAVATYDAASNGLIQDWRPHGFTFVNPPYGRKLAEWASKIIVEAEKGTEMIVLTPARTDTRWCQAILNATDAPLFWKGRMKFVDPENPDKNQSAPFPSLVTYFGKRTQSFKLSFINKGIIY